MIYYSVEIYVCTYVRYVLWRHLMHVVELRFQMMQEICEIACYTGYSPDCSNVNIACHGNTVVMITLFRRHYLYCVKVLEPYT